MKLKLIYTLAASMVLFGCNDNDSGSTSGSANGDSSGSSDTTEIKGVLIAPEQSVEANSALVERASIQPRNDDNCSGSVPSGYERIAETDVEFRDASDQPVGASVETDECGIFQTDERPDATTVYAEPEGRRPISTDANLFRRSSGASDDSVAIVSTISDSAEYEIRSLFRQSDGRLGFTVSDTETGRPVIGLPADAFTLEDQSGNEVQLDRITSGSQSREAASVSLVLDASGSMTAEVYSDGDGNSYTRYHVARDASHLFLNEKGSQDEVGIVVFGGSAVDLVNDDFLDPIDIRDANSDEIDYTFSDSGFTTSTEPLRFVIDMYDRYNNVYNNPSFGFNRDPHPDTPDLTIADGYVFSTPNTPLFDAVIEAVDATDARNNDRKAVVTLGDGRDTNSTNSLQEATDHANNVGIPVYSVALGVSETNRGYDDLKALADDTGGDFVHVEDDGAETELLNAFESIQIGLVYQYLATLQDSDAIQAGDTIELKLDHNELEATRVFTVPASSS